MIPSSPRRTWLFLLASSLAFFAPDLVVPEAVARGPAYPGLYNLYQGLLVAALFWYGPAVCRALVVAEVAAGPLSGAVAGILAELPATPLPRLPVTLAEHPAPFVVTAGLLPGRSAVFLSSGLAARLGPLGLRVLLARALAHGAIGQRLAALLPVLVLTLAWPDDFGAPATWLLLAAGLAAWLALHWAFELRADRAAARALGPGAELGLLEVQGAAATLAGLAPPLRWRLRAVAAGLLS